MKTRLRGNRELRLNRVACGKSDRRSNLVKGGHEGETTHENRWISQAKGNE